MSILTDIRQALHDALCTIDGLNVSPYQTDQIAPPQAMIVRGQIDYDLSMERGHDLYNFTVAVLVPRIDELAAQAFLDDLCAPNGATSLKTIVEADTGLQAVVDYAYVRRASEVQVLPGSDPNTQYLSVDFEMEVVVSN